MERRAFDGVGGYSETRADAGSHTTVREERPSACLGMQPAKRQRVMRFEPAHATTLCGPALPCTTWHCNLDDSFTPAACASTTASPGRSSWIPRELLCNFEVSSAQPSVPAEPSPCRNASRTSSFCLSSSAGTAWGPALCRVTTSRDEAVIAAVSKEEHSVTGPAAPAAPGCWQHLPSPVTRLLNRLECPEEWMTRVHPALGLSSPDTLRLALHTWRRVQLPVTMLVHVRAQAVPGSSGRAAASAAAPVHALRCGPASSSGSLGGSSGCGGSSSPAPFAPAATAACPSSSWPAAVLATSRRVRTERAFAAACMRLAAKLQEQREVRRARTGSAHVCRTGSSRVCA